MDYSWESASPFLRSDNWRFVEIVLIPFYKGAFSFDLLWGDPVHPSPIKAICMLLNAHYFDLQMQYDAILGTLFLVGVCCIVSFHSITRLDLKNKGFEQISIGMLVPVLMLAFSGYVNYQWPLLALGYIDFFIAILLLVFYEKLFYSRDFGYLKVAWIILFHSIGLIFSYHMLLIVSVSIISVLMIPLMVGVIKTCYQEGFIPFPKLIKFFNDHWQIKNSFQLIIGVCCSVLIAKLALEQIGMEGADANLKVLRKIQALGEHPFSFPKTFGVALLFGYFDPRIFAKMSSYEPHLSYIGMLLCVLSILSFIGYIVKKKYEKTLLPLFLFLSFVAFFLVVFASRNFRFNDEEYMTLLWPRYHKWFMIGFVGFFLMTFHVLIDLLKSKVVLFRAFLVVSVLVTGWAWHSSYLRVQHKLPFVVQRNQIVAESIASKDLGKMNRYSSVKANKKTIRFLKKQKLSVFSERYPWKEYE